MHEPGPHHPPPPYHGHHPPPPSPVHHHPSPLPLPVHHHTPPSPPVVHHRPPPPPPNDREGCCSSATTGEWKVIHRRKNYSTNRNTREDKVVSFFVGNIPDGCGAKELREVFKGFGNLVDVYMARKKDRSCRNFGFIRYDDVIDVNQFEMSFGKIYMGNKVLVVNVSRYQRRSNDRADKKKKSFIPSFIPNNEVPEPAWGFPGQKSFASVVMNGNNNNAKKPIKLKSSNEVEKMLSEMFLVGEAKDSDILKSISILLKDEGISFRRVFFYGGLYVLIRFDNASEAMGLLKNTGCWNKWFSWLKMGNHTRGLNYKRAADVEIVGLPLHLRSVDNINKILDDIGIVLTVEEDMWKSDLSSCVGCVLTESKTLINKEMVVEDDNERIFNIGIIEKGFRLKPFNDEDKWGDNEIHGTTDMNYMNNIDEEDEGCKGISESCNNDEWEEGEFRSNNADVRLEIRSSTGDVTSPTNEVSIEALNASNIRVADCTVIEDSVENISKNFKSPTGDVTFPNDEASIEALNASNIRVADSTVIGESVENISKIFKSAPDSHVPWAPTNISDLNFVIPLSPGIAKDLKFGPLCASAPIGLDFTNGPSAVCIPGGPTYTDGLCFSFGSTSKFKKRRKFSPTRRSQPGDCA